jgi:hypothetical protein
MESEISTGVTLALVLLLVLAAAIVVAFAVKQSGAEKTNRFKHQK